MKKNILIIILTILFIILLFINQPLISASVINSSILFINKVLPSLLPMFILSKILINYNFPYYISKLFNNNLYIYILLISFISGSPNNIILIKDLYKNNIITIEEANKYIKCNFFTNPLFLFTMISNIFNYKIAILIIIIQLLSNIILYLFNPVKNNNIIKIKSINFSNLFNNIIKEASTILLNVYLNIIIFNIIIIFIPDILKCFIGILELTQGLNYLININLNYISKLLLTIIYISFGGLSIHFQIKSVISDTLISYNNFLIARFYQIVISIILFFILYFIINYNIYC